MKAYPSPFQDDHASPKQPPKGLRMFKDFAIVAKAVMPNSKGWITLSCPQCSPLRRKSSERCLGVNVFHGWWNCHHCHWRGNLREGETHASEITLQKARKHRPRAQDQAKAPPGATWQIPAFEGCTVAQYAEAKRLPVEFLQGVGLKDMFYCSIRVIRIPYRDVSGEERSIRFRVSLTGTERFRWRRGQEAMLYGLWKLHEAHDAAYVIIVEGESDCHTLWLHGIPAIGLPGSGCSHRIKASLGFQLENIPRIYVVIEPDEGGKRLLSTLEDIRIHDRLRLITLGDAKDPSGLYLLDPGGFRQAWQTAMDSSIAFHDYAMRHDLQAES